MSSKKITQEIIESVYEIAKDVHYGKISQANAVNELVKNHEMNKSSAQFYVHDFQLLLKGKVYKRTISAKATDYFLSKILQDFGKVEFQNALASVALHISYYEELIQRNSLAQRAVLSKFIEQEGFDVEIESQVESSDIGSTAKQAIDASVSQMIRNARLADGMSGTISRVLRKRKKVRFGNNENFQEFLKMKIREQNGKCALTGIPLQFRGEHTNKNFLCSLDRIDSDGDYEPVNLQVVCRFINRWKSDSDNDEFKSLISLIRSRLTS